mgnify:FL=1
MKGRFLFSILRQSNNFSGWQQLYMYLHNEDKSSARTEKIKSVFL